MPLSRRDQLLTLVRIPLTTCAPCLVATTIDVPVLLQLVQRLRRSDAVALNVERWSQLDAVHRARRQTKVTSRATLGDNRMHEPLRTDDGIDRAGGQALCTADTPGLIDVRNRWQSLDAIQWVQRLLVPSQETRQRADGDFTTRRALIDVGAARSQCFGVWAASWIAAARALRLWKKGVDLLDEIVHDSLDLHTRLCALIRGQQENTGAVTCSEHHALGGTETHFARRKVRHHHDMTARETLGRIR